MKASPIIGLLVALSQLHLSIADNFDEKDLFYGKEKRLNLTLAGTTNSYAQAINYGQTHPTRDGGSWSGWYNLSMIIYVFIGLVSNSCVFCIMFSHFMFLPWWYLVCYVTRFDQVCLADVACRQPA
jgi:hypothetical protein